MNSYQKNLLPRLVFASLLLVCKDSYFLTFTTSAKLDGKYAPVFEQIAKTFR